MHNKAIVFYSGGISSFVAAKFAVERFGKDNVELLFTDTKTEDEDLYRFLREGAEALGAKLTILADGRDLWQLFNDIRFVANSRLDPCSRILKRELARKYITKTADTSTLLVFGIDEFEAHRAAAISKNYEPYQCWYPLIEKVMGHSEKVEVLTKMGIRPPRLYTLGFAHNNCGGFCVKAGQAHFAHLYRTMPERYEYHARKEREIIASGVNHKGIIRATVNGKRMYMTLDDFKRHIEANMFEAHDVRGCGCFTEIED